jgi:hypothetical protein
MSARLQSDFDCPGFVGALLAGGSIVGTAFVCASPHLVVTCAHSLNDGMTNLAWRSADGTVIPLSGWRFLYFDAELDIAVITSNAPILRHSLVADLPRHVIKRGVTIYFSAVSEYVESDDVEYPFDSGEGRVIGEHIRQGQPRRAKIKSSDVTPGCSGAPVLHYSDIGVTIVGMISGRYNSPDWNRDSVWMVLADDLRDAISKAHQDLRVAGVYLDLLTGLGASIAAEDLRAQMRRIAADSRTHGSTDRFSDLPFQSNAISEDFLSGLEPWGARPAEDLDSTV